MRRTDGRTPNFSPVTGLAMMERQYTRADEPREAVDRDTRSPMSDKRCLTIGGGVLVMSLLAGGLLDGPAAGNKPEGAMRCLDMATGVVTRGKLVQARKTNQPIPPGWALDRDGNPTTDPQAALIPLPLGGPKGSGLSR